METLLKNELILSDYKIKNTALILRALDNHRRRRILRFIHERGQVTVTEIYKRLRLEQSVTSQQLSILRTSGVVTTERNGRFIWYRINYSLLRYLDAKMDAILAKKEAAV